MARFRRRSRAERLRDRGDVRRLVRLLGAHERLVARDGTEVDLAVGQRLEAVAALGAIDAPEAEAAVVGALEDDDVRVRRAAIEALRPSPSARAIKLLALAAASWRGPAVLELREAAIALLADLRDEVAAVAYAHALVDDAGRSSLDPWEEEALSALFAADSGPATEIFALELADRLASEDDRGRRAWQAIVAIGEMSVPPLVAALDDPRSRLSAAAALGALRDARAVGPLVTMLDDERPEARAAAARALGAIRDPGAVDALVRASADPHADVRDAAMDALDRMRSVVIAMLGSGALDASATPPERAVVRRLLGQRD